MRSVFAFAALVFALTGQAGRQICAADQAAPVSLCQFRARLIVGLQRVKSDIKANQGSDAASGPKA